MTNVLIIFPRNKSNGTGGDVRGKGILGNLNEEVDVCLYKVDADRVERGPPHIL